MKKFWKILSSAVLAVVLLAVGYAWGSRAGENSITSALPHLSLERETPKPSLEATNMPITVTKKPEDKKEESAENKKTETGKASEPTEPEKTGRTVVKTDDSAAKDTWSTLNSYEGDLLNNGKDAKVTLYTSAETDDGEVLWDDGQSWVVEVSDENGGHYTLLEKYIKNGSVYFEVNGLDNGKNAITVFIKTAAGLEVKQYTYSGDGFTEATLYNSGHQNTVYSSMPDYQ